MHLLQFYHFSLIFDLELEKLKEFLYKLCTFYEFKGLILIAKEGINLSIAGDLSKIHQFMDNLQNQNYINVQQIQKRIQDVGEIQPYRKLVIKIKSQIIPFPEEVDIKQNKNRFLSPEEFHELVLQNKAIPVDTRNYYEWAIGSFQNAIKFPIRKFRELPQQYEWFLHHYQQNPDKIFVTFCTGGIRCEKVVPFLVSRGLDRIYQIQGGILSYFEKFAYQKEILWEGECFVFDERYTILPNGQRGKILPCLICGQPVLEKKCIRCGAKLQIA